MPGGTGGGMAEGGGATPMQEKMKLAVIDICFLRVLAISSNNNLLDFQLKVVLEGDCTRQKS